MTDKEMPTEQSLRNNLVMLETAKAQLDGLARQQQLIQLAIEEHMRARETVKQLAKGSPGNTVLIPLGADSYVHAKISEDRDSIVGIGSGISVRRTPEEAEKILDAKIDDLSRALKSVADRVSQTEALIQELTDKVEAQYSTLQSGGQA
ncbi:MAG: prefoldin subunit alpha [Thermoplasmata archaeon]